MSEQNRYLLVLILMIFKFRHILVWRNIGKVTIIGPILTYQ